MPWSAAASPYRTSLMSSSFDACPAVVDDDRLADESKEGFDLLVGRQVVAGHDDADPEHLRDARRFVGGKLAGEIRAGAGDAGEELAWLRAADQPHGRPVQLAEEAHVEDRGVAVVVDANARLRLDDEGERHAAERLACRESGHRPVVALDWPDTDAGDLRHQPPDGRLDLLARNALVDEQPEAVPAGEH